MRFVLVRQTASCVTKFNRLAGRVAVKVGVRTFMGDSPAGVIEELARDLSQLKKNHNFSVALFVEHPHGYHGWIGFNISGKKRRGLLDRISEFFVYDKIPMKNNDRVGLMASMLGVPVSKLRYRKNR